MVRFDLFGVGSTLHFLLVLGAQSCHLVGVIRFCHFESAGHGLHLFDVLGFQARDLSGAYCLAFC